MEKKLRIAHVTEASSAGVLHAVASLSRAQHEAGAEASFVFIPRPDTPHDDELQALMPGVRLVRVGRPTDDMIQRLRTLRRSAAHLYRSGSFDVVHAHSSLAGFAVRTVSRRLHGATLTCYSPHGFSFLRSDIRGLHRRTFLCAESLLADRAVLLAASDSELTTARDALRPSRSALLSNGVDFGRLPERPERVDARPVVGMIGRITYQKAPWRFADVARRLSEWADFVWIGDGPAERKAQWFGSAPVRVTGWLNADDALAMVAKLDVVCFATLWEGMPLALLDAQALGVPAVATRIVGNMDVIEDGVTGYLVDTEEELVEAVDALVKNGPIRERMGEQALSRARSRFDSRVVSSASLSLYKTYRTEGRSHDDPSS